ncbi:MAG: putative addiction module antidote protein [Acaryochloridaceae cyanobacterium CSU_3_4]|nr:putative addiction module antidote protein [Acaryochloridaceae cyanobacterium CSU_3_4]
MKLTDILETFEGDLQDPEFAQVYLEEALKDGFPNFLIALRHVVLARQGMNDLANEIEVGRESLYKSLSEEGNPPFVTIAKVIEALGLRLSIVPASASNSC